MSANRLMRQGTRIAVRRPGNAKMNAMTIGILIPEFPSQTHIFFWREIAELRRIGVDVAVLSTTRPSEDACPHAFATAARVETHYVYPPRWIRALAVLLMRPASVLRCVRYFRRLERASLAAWLRRGGLLICAADLCAYARARRIRHIHGHSCADAAHVVALCRELGGPPYSLMLHGDLQVYGRDHGIKTAGASFVLVAGPHLVDQVVNATGYPPARVVSTWMGIETDRFIDAGTRNYEIGRLHIATVARLDECKGHRYALAALRAIIDRGIDARYTLVGSGPNRAFIESEVARQGLSEHVEFTGTRSETEVLHLLQQVDVFVLPSVGVGEAYGVATLEAMSCGLPVICSNIGSTSIVVEDGVSGFLVEQRDVAGLTTLLLQLAEDPDLRRRMGAAARQRMLPEFSVNQTASLLWNLIQTATPPNPPAAVPTTERPPPDRAPVS